MATSSEHIGKPLSAFSEPGVACLGNGGSNQGDESAIALEAFAQCPEGRALGSVGVGSG